MPRAAARARLAAFPADKPNAVRALD